MTFGFRSLAVSVALAAALCATSAQAGSIRFFGHGTNDIDRVKIRIDDPNTDVEPPRPADVGGDFTIEFWVKGLLADNNTGDPRCGNQYGWINGHIVFDRDRFSRNGAWGISISRQGWVSFGVNGNDDVETVCGQSNVLDGNWHHVAVTRTTGGQLRLFVDGVQEASSNGGPTGDISYPDNAVPFNNCGATGNQSCNFSDPFIVLGAEKHDVAPASAPSFDGFMDELRISSIVRYTANFTPSSTPFVSDASTAGLYHFDEATSGGCTTGTVITDSATGLSPGFCSFGGSAPAGPVWSSDTPFTSTSPGTLQLQSAIFSGTEGGGTIRINATRVGGTDGVATVNYATTNGAALAGSDYIAASGVLSWNAGQGGTQFFDITILDDTAAEAAETFTVTLSSASGATLGTPSTATATINDDDNNGTLQLSSATYTVSEEAGPLTVTVQRVGGSDGAVTVDYATSDGSAQAGVDYQPASGTLNWPDGDATNKSFNVAMLNDTEPDTGETFSVTLSNPAGGATLGAPSVATATITDSDSPGTLQFTVASLGVTEGVGVNAVLQVSRTGGSGGAASVRCTTSNGSAQEPGDYTRADVTLNWASGDATSKNCSIPITNDNVDEGTTAETFSVALSMPTNASLGTSTSATVSITDDDDAGSLQLSAAAYSASEDAGSLTVTVRRTVGNDGPVSVNYATAPGTALAGSEYTHVSGTLTWADQDMADKSFAVPILNDTELDNGKTFIVAISGPTGNAALGTPATATVTIDDSDRTGTLQFASAAHSVLEDAGTVVMQVTRANGSAGAVSVTCTTTDGSAVQPLDYAQTSMVLSWASGDAQPKACVVPIVDDSVDEIGPAETFSANLGQVTGGVSLGTPATAVVSIQDNDPTTGSLQFSQNGFTVVESDGVATITVQRVGGTETAASVQYSTTAAGSTATAGQDYTPTSGTLQWNDGDGTSRQFQVQVASDTNVEQDETVRLQLTNFFGATPGNPVNTALTIVNDDVAAPGALIFSSATYNVGEGAGSVTVTVRRIGGDSGNASVNYSTSNGTATNPADYTAASGQLMWTNGDATDRTIQVTINDDGVLEGAETFNIQLSNANGPVIGSIGSASISIADDDVARPGSVQLAQSGFVVAESAGALTVGVTRTGGTDGSVSVTVTTANGSAIAGSDFGFQNTTVSWAAGEGGSKSVSIQIVDDSDEEPDENFTVSLINVAGGATIGTPSSATVSIGSNDVTSEDSRDSGGGAMQWWMLFLGLLPALRALRAARF